ncbi:MAG: nucleotide sugar dehydrogenase [Gemmatimonadota bacterium]|nr:nucleotide sugar dehydrogenase [Gemmatimonadota bacterium]
MVKNRLEHFQNADLIFGVIGLGYVGLPLAVEAARTGIRVVGFDVKDGLVEGVNAGKSHILDLSDEDVAVHVAAGRLEATCDLARIAECDAVSICVPTPLSKTRDPDVSFIMSATRAVAEALRPGHLIVLESTTYPGTTRELVLPACQSTGLKVGEDFFLCFSPERVDPGNPDWQTRNTPKVIGGITPRCRAVGQAFYGRFIETTVPVSSVEAAELTKILENTFRSVNIGLVNETAIIADRLGVDVWEVVDAAATKPFGFMKFNPGPGLGGHCIPVDPHYLSWKMRTLNYKTRFIDLASEINAEMPIFVVNKVREALNASRKSVNGSTVLMLGVAYKPDVDDVRESPALDVMQLLQADGAKVLYSDPYVPRVNRNGDCLESVALTPELLNSVDATVIVTDHSAFDYEAVVEHSRALVDARNATARVRAVRMRGERQRWIVKSENP